MRGSSGKPMRNQDPNSISASLGTTALGSAWALRALHPCDERTSGGAAIPNLSETESANMEVRHSQILSKPGSIAESGNWDVQIAVLPFADAGIAYRVKSSSVAAWQFWTLLTPTQGNITPGNSLLANGTNPFNPGAAPALSLESTGFRQTFRGLTVVMNSSSMTNQGLVTVGQWGVKPDVISLAPVTAGATDTPEPIEHTFISGIPSSPDDIVVACPQAGQWEARKGVYMPMRFQDPQHEYTPATANEVMVGADMKKLGMPILLGRPGTDDLLSYLSALVYVDPNSSSFRIYTSAGRVNQNFGTVIFSGIDATTSLAIKLRSGLELTAKGTSGFANFTASADILDQQAIDAVQVISTRLKVAYTHDYNSAGLLLGALATAAKTAIPMLANWVANKIFSKGSGTPNV